MIYTVADIPTRPSWKAFARTFQVGDMISVPDTREADIIRRSMYNIGISVVRRRINEDIFMERIS